MGKTDASRQASEEADAYLAALPADTRSCLERVRSLVREMAPECTERVGYGIPTFRLRRDLVGMSARGKRCPFHTMSPPLMAAIAAEWQGVRVSGATIHFSADRPLPRELLEGIVRKRMAEVATA